MPMSAKDRVIVVESICYGTEHVPFNASMLMIIAAAYPDKQICFFSEARHLELVLEQLPSEERDRISKRSIDIPARRSSFWTRFLFEINFIAHVLQEPNSRATDIVILCAQESTIFALKANLIKYRNSVNSFVILHGHVASIDNWRSKNPFIRVHDLTSSIKIGKNQNIGYIFLEKHITERIKRIIPSAEQVMFTLPHPILPTEILEKKQITQTMPIKIGFLGQTTEHKGYPQFLRLAIELKDRRPGKVEFHVYGATSEETRLLDTTHLDSAPTEMQIPRNQFLEHLTKLHYVCLPFNGSHYKLAASGVIFDAFSSCTPILAVNSDALIAIFKHATPGVLATSIEEIIDYLIKFIDSPDWQKYFAQCEEAHRIALTRSTPELCAAYQSIVETVNLNHRTGQTKKKEF